MIIHGSLNKVRKIELRKFYGEWVQALGAVISGIKALVMIGRWYSRKPLTNHNLRLYTKTIPEIIAPKACTHFPYNFLNVQYSYLVSNSAESVSSLSRKKRKRNTGKPVYKPKHYFKETKKLYNGLVREMSAVFGL